MNADPNAAPDIRERSQVASAAPAYLDRRLFMQFLAFGSADTAALVQALTVARLPGVLYEDINDPFGVGLLAFHEEAGFFIDELRTFLRRPPFGHLTPKPEYTMLGRTYPLGNERDLADALLRRPRQKVCDPATPWAIWYPLRRKGSFEQLPAAEQRVILMEHGGVGHAYGRAGHGTDIRLACHGLDKNDNDFVIGLLGPELYPLSSLVQRMRQTKQTSLYLERLGPFFIGRAVWQGADPA
jgi:chlorite dismutase